MIHFGNPQKYVNLVKMCNDKTLLKVRFLQRLSPAFDVNSGLRQGDTNVYTLYIRCKRLEWLGHVWRADGDVLKNVLIGKINKKHPLGRPRR